MSSLAIAAATGARWPALLRRRSILFIAMLLSGGLLIFPRLPLLALLGLLCWTQGGFRLNLKRSMWPIVVLLLVVLLATLLRPGGADLLSLSIRYANFIGAWMLLRVYLDAEPGALAGDLAAVVRWLALQAVLTVPIALALGPLFMTVDVNGTEYRTLLWLFTFHETLTGVEALPRPDGFFFEPGAYQIYLNAYLYVALFVRRRWTDVGLALLAVLSTQSTTGVVIAVGLLAAYAFQSGRNSSPLLRLGRVVLIASLLVPVGWIAQQNITDKVVGEARGSSWAREHDLFTGLNIIAEHPWLGIGFDHSRYIELSGAFSFADTKLSAESAEQRSSSNGILVLMYSLGLPLGAVFLIGLFRQQLLPHRGLIGMWLGLSLISEALVFSPFVLMFIFSAYVTQRRGPNPDRQVAGGQAP